MEIKIKKTTEETINLKPGDCFKREGVGYTKIISDQYILKTHWRSMMFICLSPQTSLNLQRKMQLRNMRKLYLKTFL